MNLKQLKYVLVLANAGSFSKASSILNISQPSLSQYIKKIEQQNGIELFERSNGNVRITDAGRVYIDAGRKILEIEHDMQNRFLDIAQNKSGSLIVGTSYYRSASLMPDVTAEFHKKYPQICIIVSEMETHDLLDAAHRGEFDICVTNLPIDERDFKYEIVADEELLIAVKKGSDLDIRLKNNRANVMSELKFADIQSIDGERFVMLTENQVMQKTLDNICFDYGITLKRVVVVNSIEAQIEMVGKGVGAALVPAGVKNLFSADSQVSFYHVLQQLPKRKLAVIYQADKHLSEPIRDLIDIIKDKQMEG